MENMIIRRWRSLNTFRQTSSQRGRERSNLVLIKVCRLRRVCAPIFQSRTLIFQLSRFGILVFEQTRLIIHPNSGYDNFSKKFIQESESVILGNPIRQEAVVAYCLSSFLTLLVQFHGVSNRIMIVNGTAPLSDLSVMIVGHGHVGRSLEKTSFTNEPYLSMTLSK